MPQAHHDLKGLNLSEIEDLVLSLGEPKYRARQIRSWIYGSGVASFEEMTDLSLVLRNRLSQTCEIGQLRSVKTVQAPDGTSKTLFELRDELHIESVFIPEATRRTVCVSTQVGCPLRCAFCATGRMGYRRNLTAGEIVDQVIQVQKLLGTGEWRVGTGDRRLETGRVKGQGKTRGGKGERGKGENGEKGRAAERRQNLAHSTSCGIEEQYAGQPQRGVRVEAAGTVRNGEMAEEARTAETGGQVHRVTNVVFMGMGEPLLNYEQTLKAARLLNEGVGIGARRITISTAGIVPGIRKLAQEGLQVKLAVALNAPRDDLRNRLMPINRHYPLKSLRLAMKDYAEATGKLLTIEYVLLGGVNDSAREATELVKFLRSVPCKLNLIPYNPAGTKEFARPSKERTERFQRYLRQHLSSVTLRHSRGGEVSAACGQLWTQKTERQLPR